MRRLAFALLLTAGVTADGWADDQELVAAGEEVLQAVEDLRWSAIGPLEHLARVNPLARSGLAVAMHDPAASVRVRAAAAWIHVGGDPDRLRRLLTNEREFVRMETAKLLIRSGRGVPLALDALWAMEMTSDASYSYSLDRDEIYRSLGPGAARTAVPVLLRRLETGDEDQRYAASKMLRSLPTIDADSLRDVLRLLGSDDEGLKIEAAGLVSHIHPGVEDAAPVVRGYLDLAEGTAAIAIAEALATIAPDDPAYLPVLVTGLLDERGSVREAAAHSLTVVGRDAQGVVPALAEWLRCTGDPSDPAIDRSAVEALTRIGAPAVPALARAIDKETDWRVRRTAAEILGRIGPAGGGAATAALIHAAAAQRTAVRQAAIVAIGKLGRVANPAVPVLVAALDEADDTDRRAAAEALGMVGPLPETARQALLAALHDSEFDVRVAAAHALARHGERAGTLLPVLLPLVSDAAPDLCQDALRAIQTLGPDADAAVPRLIGALSLDGMVAMGFAGTATDLSVTASVVVETLAAIGPSAVPALIDALWSADPEVRWLAADALGRIGPPAVVAVPALRDRLNDRGTVGVLVGCVGYEALVSQNVALALWHIGPPAAGAVPDLIALIKRTDSGDPEWSRENTCFREAVIALRHIAPGNAQAAAALRSMLHRDPDGGPWEVTLSLAAVTPDPREKRACIESLLEYVQQTGSELDAMTTSEETMRLVARMGRDADPFVPTLRFMAYDHPLLHPRYRCDAALALARLDPADPRPVEYLRRVARYGEEFFAAPHARLALESLQRPSESP